METALQILIVTLDHDSTAARTDDEVSDGSEVIYGNRRPTPRVRRQPKQKQKTN